MNGSLLTSIQNSLLSSDSVFFAIAGVILVVIASMWGFQKVKNLLDDSGSSYLDDTDYSSLDKAERRSQRKMVAHHNYASKHGDEAYDNWLKKRNRDY